MRDVVDFHTGHAVANLDAAERVPANTGAHRNKPGFVAGNTRRKHTDTPVGGERGNQTGTISAGGSPHRYPAESEAGWLGVVVDLAHLRGWLVYHTHDSRHSA